MGIFDFFKPKPLHHKCNECGNPTDVEFKICSYCESKKSTPERDESKNEKDNSYDSKLRIHFDELEDVGIVTHYKGSPFSGIGYGFDEEEKLEIENTFRDGLRNGITKTFHKDGTLYSKQNYKNDKEDGLIKIYEYTEDGECKICEVNEKEFFEYNLKRRIIMGLEQDKMKNTTKEDNSKNEIGNSNDSELRIPIEEIKIIDGVFHYQGILFSGIGVSVYESGQLKMEQNCKEGKKDGVYKYYYESGQLKNEINFKDGKKDGLQKIYYENGHLDTEGNVKNEKEDGLWKRYNENGKLTSEINYTNGKQHGSTKWWYDNGVLNGEGNFNHGIKEGVVNTYYKNGVKQYSGVYKDGEMGEGLHQEWDQNGKLTLHLLLKDGIQRTPFNTLQIQEQISFESGKKFQVFYLKGNLIEEPFNGIGYVLFDSKKIHKETTFKKGLKENYKEWDSKGKLLKEINYSTKDGEEGKEIKLEKPYQYTPPPDNYSWD
jgi:antitoxin component YwqK of YwqJK toxin-antitoxin module